MAPSHGCYGGVVGGEGLGRRFARVVLGGGRLEGGDLPCLRLDREEVWHFEKIELFDGVSIAQTKLLKTVVLTSPSVGSGSGCRGISMSMANRSTSS